MALLCVLFLMFTDPPWSLSFCFWWLFTHQISKSNVHFAAYSYTWWDWVLWAMHADIPFVNVSQTVLCYSMLVWKRTPIVWSLLLWLPQEVIHSSFSRWLQLYLWPTFKEPSPTMCKIDQSCAFITKSEFVLQFSSSPLSCPISIIIWKLHTGKTSTIFLNT